MKFPYHEEMRELYNRGVINKEQFEKAIIKLPTLYDTGGINNVGNRKITEQQKGIKDND